MEIESTTQKGVVYTTSADSCTCKGFFYRGICKHIKEVREL